ncbi:hypothetical protein Patl1_10518 [Pistacia atlantica]|uniref:Uncharacterized protein n=1 Tax=Pistacia atlantica TaxID=434234 RepID=A0ACC1A5U8_9ROSI|nr:hypothetical protein Patl1_10518 [Pistacia atlantica]
MAFRHKETVEIHKKQEGFSGPYYTATILAAIGKTKYLASATHEFGGCQTILLMLMLMMDGGWEELIHLEWEDGKWVYPGNSREVPSSDF